MNQKNSPTYMFVFRGSGAMSKLTPEQMRQSFEKWTAWIESMRARGVYLAGEPLEDGPGKVLRGPRGKLVTDGPFAEAKEVVGGYMLIATKTFDEAVAIARDCPGLENGGSVEVRQIMPLPI